MYRNHAAAVFTIALDCPHEAPHALRVGTAVARVACFIKCRPAGRQAGNRGCFFWVWCTKQTEGGTCPHAFLGHFVVVCFSKSTPKINNRIVISTHVVCPESKRAPYKRRTLLLNPTQCSLGQQIGQRAPCPCSISDKTILSLPAFAYLLHLAVRHVVDCVAPLILRVPVAVLMCRPGNETQARESQGVTSMNQPPPGGGPPGESKPGSCGIEPPLGAGGVFVRCSPFHVALETCS